MHFESAHRLVLFATVLATVVVVLVPDDLEGLRFKNSLVVAGRRRALVVNRDGRHRVVVVVVVVVIFVTADGR